MFVSPQHGVIATSIDMVEIMASPRPIMSFLSKHGLERKLACTKPCDNSSSQSERGPEHQIEHRQCHSAAKQTHTIMMATVHETTISPHRPISILYSKPN